VAWPFARLLLATEHGEFDMGAEALAFALARQQGLPLAALLPVLSNPEYETVAPARAARADAEAATRRLGVEAAALALGVALTLKVRHGPEPSAEIVAEARESGCDLLVIRRRGERGFLANLLVGEMVSKVVTQAPCNLLIVPRTARLWSRRVLVGVDPQAPDGACLLQAAALAAEGRLPLTVVCVAADTLARAGAEEALARAVEQARATQAQVDGEVRIGRAAEGLIGTARDRGADLIVVSRQGGAPVLRAWIGGTAQKVIGRAECPVLVHVSPT
jgi:hypothetical protein